MISAVSNTFNQLVEAILPVESGIVGFERGGGVLEEELMASLGIALFTLIAMRGERR